VRARLFSNVATDSSKWFASMLTRMPLTKDVFVCYSYFVNKIGLDESSLFINIHLSARADAAREPPSNLKATSSRRLINARRNHSAKRFDSTHEALARATRESGTQKSLLNFPVVIEATF
jgi:hypothetical protein